MANGIIDPAVLENTPELIESEAGVREARFLSNVAPVLTGLVGTALLGPAAGVGLGLLQRRGSLNSLETAQNRARGALLNYQERIGRVSATFEQANKAIEAVSKYPGIGPERLELARSELQNYYQQAKSSDPETAFQGLEGMRNLTAGLGTDVMSLDAANIQESRNFVRTSMEDNRQRVTALVDERASLMSDLGQALDLLKRDDFDLTNQNNRGLLLDLLRTSASNAPSYGQALAAVPFLGQFISGVATAEEFTLSKPQAAMQLIAAKNAVEGTFEELVTPIAQEAAQTFEPLNQTYRLLPEGSSAVDYILGRVPNEFAPMPSQAEIMGEFMPEEPVPVAPGETSSAARQGSARRDMVRSAQQSQAANAAIARINSQLDPGYSVAIDSENRIVARGPNGEVTAINLTEEQEAAIRQAQQLNEITKQATGRGRERAAAQRQRQRGQQ